VLDVEHWDAGGSGVIAILAIHEPILYVDDDNRCARKLHAAIISLYPQRPDQSKLPAVLAQILPPARTPSRHPPPGPESRDRGLSPHKADSPATPAGQRGRYPDCQTYSKLPQRSA